MAIQPVDLHRKVCGLKGLCLNHLELKLFSITVFTFTNRTQTPDNLLVYGAIEFWLCQKGFSEGKLAWWLKSGHKTALIRASELKILLAQGNPEKAVIPDDWKPVNQATISADKVSRLIRGKYALGSLII